MKVIVILTYYTVISKQRYTQKYRVYYKNVYYKIKILQILILLKLKSYKF